MKMVFKLSQSILIGSMIAIFLYCVPIYKAPMDTKVYKGQELRDIQDALRIPIYKCDRNATYGGARNVGDFEGKDPIWLKFNVMSSASSCAKHFASFVDKKESISPRRLVALTSLEENIDSGIKKLNKSNLVRYILLAATLAAFLFCLHIFQ